MAGCDAVRGYICADTRLPYGQSHCIDYYNFRPLLLGLLGRYIYPVIFTEPVPVVPKKSRHKLLQRITEFESQSCPPDADVPSELGRSGESRAIRFG
jgi:hypothetical protein